MQWAILGACALLLLGFVLRAAVRPLQIFFVPASVIGGAIGLVAVQVALHRPSVAGPARDLADAWHAWPAVLIAVVFAGLLLEKPERPAARALRGAASAGAYAWIVIVGQVVLGLAATWLVIAPRVDVPPSFGQLIEAGFAGGHGTATALGGVYADLVRFPAGRDLGLFSATVGLVVSVVFGIGLVNLGVRRGWTATGRADLALISGLEQRRSPTPLGWARVRGEVVDPFAFQILIVAAAYGVGVGLQWSFALAARGLPLGDAGQYLERVPLFLFTLIGGLAVRKTMTAAGVGDLIDAESVKRIVAVSMEFLIVAAIASLRLETVAAYLWPISLLLGLGCAWCVFCLLVVAPRLLPRDHWFELGLINFGMSTGTTAQGMMLLRIVDRDLETGAAEDYALAAPLSAPFIGGGVITLSLPLILAKAPVPVVIAVLAVAMAIALGIGIALRRGS